MGNKRRSAVSTSPKALRRIAAELFREQAAILLLANSSHRLTPEEIEANLDGISALTTVSSLNQAVSELRDTVRSMRNELGVRASRDDLFRFIEWLKSNLQERQLCFVPIGLLSKYISVYDAGPPHARIGIDYLGISKDYPGGFEIRLLEASLFEDMCAVFNMCKEAKDAIPSDQPRGSLPVKIALKKHGALMRATLSAAFYFVESYINCLAADFLHTRGSELTENERMLLTEWNSTAGRYRPVTTREKLVQYPRIMTRSEFPPLDENNCPELQYFVTTAKDFRDAIVHASTTLDPQKGYPRKELAFINLKHDDVMRAVDTTVSLVRKISVVVHGKAPNWLHDRDLAIGCFPAVAFE